VLLLDSAAPVELELSPLDISPVALVVAPVAKVVLPSPSPPHAARTRTRTIVAEVRARIAEDQPSGG
jgi:hypothetical protein